MTIVFPVCRKDSPDLLRLLVWIKKLGPCKNHRALIVSDADTPYRDCLDAQQLAGELFSECRMVATKEHVEGWPQGGNALFKLACQHVNEPWFWCESDCVPIKAGWADALAAEYDKCGKPFMGPVIPTNNPKFPALYLNGTSVYPANALRTLAVFCDGDKAWDVASAGTVVPQAADTRLIQHFWGKPNLAPTFVERKTAQSPVNAFSLADLRKEAVIFHRCKDGSLIRLLSGESNAPIVLFPFCNKDGEMAALNMEWIASLTGLCDYDVLLSYEAGTNQAFVDRISASARRCFRNVSEYRYPMAPPPLRGPNWAFKRAAAYMDATVKRPWLWMEYDAIPLKRHWLETLFTAYEKCGQPFFGPIVPGRGHMNGTGIYPANAASLMPAMMRNSAVAGFDVQMKPEMIHLCADATPIYQHAWGVIRERLHPYLGDSPTFPTMHHVQSRIHPEAVIFHRCKDGSLIQRLRENHP